MRGVIRDWHDLLQRIRGISVFAGWRGIGTQMEIWTVPRSPGMSAPRSRDRQTVLQLLCWIVCGEYAASDAEASERLGFDTDFTRQVQTASRVLIAGRASLLPHGERYRLLTLVAAIRPPVRMPLAFRAAAMPTRIKQLLLFPELTDASGRS